MPRARLYKEHPWHPTRAPQLSVGESIGYGQRQHQEDALWWRVWEGAGVFVAFDGMGGHATGYLATEAAVRAFDERAPDTPAATIAAIQETHRRIIALEREAPALRGISTTLAALVIDHGAAHVIWAGDSRVYRWRHGRLTQLTTDDSMLEHMTARGMLTTPEEIEAFPYHHVVINTIGLPNAARGALSHLIEPVMPGDRYLCCTDGITRHTPTAQLTAALAARHRTPQDIADTLASLAAQHPHADNHTAIVVDVGLGDDAER